MLISIEGNIGSGKSTIIEYLKTLQNDKIIFVDEPVNEWLNIKDINGMNALDCFYKDKKIVCQTLLIILKKTCN